MTTTSQAMEGIFPEEMYQNPFWNSYQKAPEPTPGLPKIQQPFASQFEHILTYEEGAFVDLNDQPNLVY